jgi:hypothetical protein
VLELENARLKSAAGRAGDGLWSIGGRAGDVNGDEIVGARDVLAFLNAWNAGCP